LKDLSELPTLKEFDEIRRLAVTDEAIEIAGGPEGVPSEKASAEEA